MFQKTKKMDCLKIEKILSELKVNSRGSLRGKNKVCLWIFVCTLQN